MAKASVIAAKQANNLVELNERIAALEKQVAEMQAKLDALPAVVLGGFERFVSAVGNEKPSKKAKTDGANGN